MRGNRSVKSLDRWLGIPLALLLGGALRCRDRVRGTQRGQPRRILANKLSAVGDTVLLVPALRALRRRYPQAHLTFVCSSINREVVGCFPEVGGRALVDEVVLFDLAEHVRRPAKLLRFVRGLRQRRFDLTVDFDQWIRVTSLLTAAVGAPARLGFRTRDQHRHYVYTATVTTPRERHEVRNFLALSRLAGATAEDSGLALSIPLEAAEWARRRLPATEGRGTVAFHVGCGATGVPRQWPAARYVELGRRLVAEHEVTVVLTGGPGEKELADRVAEGIGEAATVLAGASSFAQFAALLQLCDLLVCGNTGAMHIAAAVGTPVVALHGPTNPSKWGPVGAGHTVIQSPLWCSPCLELGFEYGCETYPCMPLIEVAEVYEATVASLLRAGQG